MQDNEDVLEHLLHVNDVTMGALCYGDPHAKQVLVLLHGFTGSAESWRSLLPLLVQPDQRIIAFDLLGHGRSDAPLSSERYAMEHCSEDILAALRQLGVQEGQAILLGYSMGGRIALYCALSGFFRALVLESASPGLATEAERIERRRTDEVLAEHIEQDGIEAFVDYWEKMAFFASQKSNLSDQQRLAMSQQQLQNREQGLAQSLRGVGTGAQPSLYDRLPQIALPVLIIAGEQDQKFCLLARIMGEALPQADVHIVSQSGHIVHLEQPECFLTLVRRFCAEHAKDLL